MICPGEIKKKNKIKCHFQIKIVCIRSVILSLEIAFAHQSSDKRPPNEILVCSCVEFSIKTPRTLIEGTWKHEVLWNILFIQEHTVSGEMILENKSLQSPVNGSQGSGLRNICLYKNMEGCQKISSQYWNFIW